MIFNMLSRHITLVFREVVSIRDIYPPPTLPYPTLPYPTLPYPTLPYPLNEVAKFKLSNSFPRLFFQSNYPGNRILCIL